MIVLKGSNAVFGLPEASPYVTKTEVQLKMAGLEYEKQAAMPMESPKGQVPFILDGGEVIADSAFIRFHIEQEYGVDLDAGLSPEERAVAISVESLCEQYLATASGYFRWQVPENFDKGPRTFFDRMPADQRDAFIADVRGRVSAAMLARGVARHSPPEIVALAVRAMQAIETIMGDKPFLMADRPTGADAFVFACLAAAMTPFFPSPLHEAAIRRPKLVAYVSRMMDRFYPDFAWDCGILPARERELAA
jgi:glutathione S-transferase